MRFLCSPLARGWIRDALGPAVLAGGAVLGTAMVGALAAGIRDFLWAAPLAGSMAIPVAAMAGAIGATRRWVGEGAWIGVQSMGWSGRKILIITAFWGLAWSGVGGFWSVEREAVFRRDVREHWRADAARLPWIPGQAVSVGDFDAVARRVDAEVAKDILLVKKDFVGFVSQARRVPGGVELGEGELAGTGPSGVRIRWKRWILAEEDRRRVELDERSIAELRALIEKMASSGRPAAYERAVWAKRYVQVLLPWLGSISVVPWAARRSGWWVGGVVGIGTWAATRIGDRCALWVGGEGAALFAPGFLVGVFLLGWWLWRER